MGSIKFNESLLHMDVLCVSRYQNFTLAGIGSTLFVYSDENLLLSLPIFLGERIHSMHIRNNLILLKGGRQLSLVKFKETVGDVECHIVSKIQSSDWVQDVIMFENQLAGLVTAHNFFEYWDLGKKKQLNTSSCEEKCILYSCKIIGDALENSVIFAGTVFGDVLIWTPFLKEITMLKRFKAHNGSVFSIEVEPRNKILSTTSDDRSLKIWSVISHQFILHPNDWKNSTIQLVYNLFGHTARVWKSMILPNYYLTIGEDSKIIVWSSDGRMIKTLCLHQESGIRALDYSHETDMITTGGEDGGINAFSLNYLVTKNEVLKMFNLGQNVSTKVCFTKNGFLYIVNGNFVLVSAAGEEELVYKSDNFSSYCVLEVSPGGEYIMMGSIKGHLVILDSNRRAIIIEKQVLNGRIYSIHSVGSLLMICGPEGKLHFWELLNGGLKNVGTMSLPNCKERWTTCGAVHNEKLFLGDRMGNLHMYELHGGENPVKSFRKIHSYLGVTDVKVIEGLCFSIGRDGTMKKVTDNFTLLNTYKLPLEWPWKIVKYKDDILILGFRSISFIIWSVKDREVIASHDCGGGHRSCDYKLFNNKLSFLYVKEKKVFVTDLLLDGITRIRNGFHGKEINCLKILQNRPTVIVTGSEDTTLRISAIEKSEVKQIEVLQTHVSSVRAVCASFIERRLIIVSVGGKGQFVVWDFDLTTLKCHELVNHCLRKETQNWKSPTLVTDPHTRIMCVDILKQKNEVLIFIGCSDCQIRIFSYKKVLEQLCMIQYTHCVLNLGLLTVKLMKVLVSMGTDGKIVFWEVTDCCSVKQLETFSLHQLGINSFQFEEIECGKFILVTGGDDNLISAAFVEIFGGKVNLRRVWENKTTHSCQITGIKILKNLLITTSTDQRITLWKWCWQNDEFKVKFLSQYMTAVPDIQGMDAVQFNNSTISIAVYGKGMEILHMSINSLDQQKS